MQKQYENEEFHSSPVIDLHIVIMKTVVNETLQSSKHHNVFKKSDSTEKKSPNPQPVETQVTMNYDINYTQPEINV